MAYQLSEHHFEQTPGDAEGQGSLVCCSPWGCKESDMTEQLTTAALVASATSVSIALWILCCLDKDASGAPC